MISGKLEVQQFKVSKVYADADATRKKRPHFTFPFKGGVKFTGTFWMTGNVQLPEMCGESNIFAILDEAYVLVKIDGIIDKPVRLYAGDKIEIFDYKMPPDGRAPLVECFAETAGTFYDAVLHSYKPQNG